MAVQDHHLCYWRLKGCILRLYISSESETHNIFYLAHDDRYKHTCTFIFISTLSLSSIYAKQTKSVKGKDTKNHQRNRSNTGSISYEPCNQKRYLKYEIWNMLIFAKVADQRKLKYEIEIFYAISHRWLPNSSLMQLSKYCPQRECAWENLKLQRNSILKMCELLSCSINELGMLFCDSVAWGIIWGENRDCSYLSNRSTNWHDARSWRATWSCGIDWSS